jgi:hypothetical protein
MSGAPCALDAECLRRGVKLVGVVMERFRSSRPMGELLASLGEPGVARSPGIEWIFVNDLKKDKCFTIVSIS